MDHDRTEIRHLIRVACFVAALIHLPAAAGLVHAQAVRESTWVTDGSVNVVTSTGSTVFAAGPFTKVGPWIGSAAPLDRATGEPLKPYLRVNGSVLACVSDGAGGWYIGGSFSRVLGQPRSNLAHILAGGLLAEWAPTMDLAVRALAVAGGVVYVGGDFTLAAGQPRLHLAALDATSGALASWDPAPNSTVYTLLVNGTTLYAAGSFRRVAGRAASSVAAFDLNTGALTPSTFMGPAVAEWVAALSLDGGRLYMGGTMTYVGPPTGALARLDPVTAAPVAPHFDVSGEVHAAVSDGAGGWFLGGLFSSVLGFPRQNLAHVLADGGLSDWNPGASAGVRALALRNDSLFAGGEFSTCAGASRERLAAVSATSGAALAWNPGADGGVYGLALDGNALYVGGTFQGIAGVFQPRLAAVDLATGTLQSVQPLSPNSDVRALVLDSGRLFAGGYFTAVSPHVPNLASLDGTTGQLEPSRSTANAEITAILADGGGGWFVGGAFTTILGQARNGLAHILADGTVAAWNPGVFGTIRCMLLAGDTLYVGGALFSVAGIARQGVASLRVSTGELTSLAITLGNSYEGIHAIAKRGDTLYVGGAFDSISGQVRNGLASLHAVTGEVTSWNPAPSHQGILNLAKVTDMAFLEDRLFVVGRFDHMGGLARTNAAAFDAETGALTPWAPFIEYSTANESWKLAVGSGTVYLAGDFFRINGLPRQWLAAIDALTGQLLPWNPSPNASVHAITMRGAEVVVGGEFMTIGGQPRSRVAALDGEAGLVTSWIPDAVGGLFGSGIVQAVGTDDTRVLAGGAFLHVGGTTRNAIAAFNTTDRTLLPFDPNVNGAVFAIAVSGSKVFFGGQFTNAGGSVRNRLAAHDINLGPLSWNPNTNGNVRALLVQGTQLYAGGEFTTVGNVAHPYIASIGTNTGTVSAWNPGARGPVLVLTGPGNPLIGGAFSGIGGAARTNVAAVDPLTGALTPWAPAPDGDVRTLLATGGRVYVGIQFGAFAARAYNGATGATIAWSPNVAGPDPVVRSFAVSNDTVFMGGNFTTIKGVPHQRLGAVSASTAAVIAWNADANGVVNCMASAGGQVLAGGEFSSLRMIPRAQLAAFDARTGEPRPWVIPTFDGEVRSAQVLGDRLYLGGDFLNVAGLFRQRLVALDTTLTSVLTEDYHLDGGPMQMRASGGTLYLAGGFFSVLGQSRNGLAALEGATGMLTTWNPNANAIAWAIEPAGSVIYVGGQFTSVGGAARNRIAALDPVTGAATSWNPNANNLVKSIATNAGKVYAGGQFTTIGGQSRARIAELDPVSGAATAWDAGGVDGSVDCLLAANGAVMAGGTFTAIGGAGRYGFAVLDAATGHASGWAPDPKYNVRTLLRDGGTLYIGGAYSSIAAQARQGFAAFADPSYVPPLVVEPDPVPSSLNLALLHSNPLHGSGILRLTLPRAGTVHLRLHDAAGRVVRTLVDGALLPAGVHEVTLDASGLAPGIYWCHLANEGETRTRRVVILP